MMSKGTREALVFLHTVGAKALVISENVTLGNDVVILENLDEEFVAKQEMVIEEQIRIFKRNMSIEPGLLVLKRGQDNKTREIYVRYVMNDGSYGIAWKSKYFNMNKYFDLSSLFTEQQFPNEETHTPDGFIRLRNPTRHIDLKFESESVQKAFLVHVSTISTDKNRELYRESY